MLKLLGSNKILNDKDCFFGRVGRRQVYRPWPNLIRSAGSVGSGRSAFNYDLIRQAAMLDFKVITLDMSDEKPVRTLVEACSSYNDGRKVGFLDLTRNSHLLNVHSFIQYAYCSFMWDVSPKNKYEYLDTFLTVLLDYVENYIDDSRRTVISLDNLVAFKHGSETLSQLINACLIKNVTLILSDGIDEGDSASLLRSADLLAIFPLPTDDARHPYVEKLLSGSPWDIKAINSFFEGFAVMAYKNHLNKPFFDKVCTNYYLPTDIKKSDMDRYLVRLDA